MSMGAVALKKKGKKCMEPHKSKSAEERRKTTARKAKEKTTDIHHRIVKSSDIYFFFFQAEDGIRDYKVTGVQTCALPICQDSQAAGQGSHHAGTGCAAC